jgi:hypothetical protein
VSMSFSALLPVLVLVLVQVLLVLMCSNMLEVAALHVQGIESEAQAGVGVGVGVGGEVMSEGVEEEEEEAKNRQRSALFVKYNVSKALEYMWQLLDAEGTTDYSYFHTCCW